MAMTQPTAPITVPSSRALAVSTLHAAAEYLADETSLPTPTDARISVHEVPFTVLQQIAASHGSEIQYGLTNPSTCWVTVPIAVEALHGIAIDYVAFGRVPATTPMDVPARGEGVTTDPWADVMPAPRGRCEAVWPGPENGRCVHPADHDGAHFFDDEKGHGA
jgi:hypothetical protein